MMSPDFLCAPAILTLLLSTFPFSFAEPSEMSSQVISLPGLEENIIYSYSTPYFFFTLVTIYFLVII